MFNQLAQNVQSTEQKCSIGCKYTAFLFIAVNKFHCFLLSAINKLHFSLSIMALYWHIYRTMGRSDVFQFSLFYQSLDNAASRRFQQLAEELELTTGNESIGSKVLCQLGFNLFAAHRHGVGFQVRTINLGTFHNLLQPFISTEGYGFE